MNTRIATITLPPNFKPIDERKFQRAIGYAVTWGATESRCDISIGEKLLINALISNPTTGRNFFMQGIPDEAGEYTFHS